MTTARTRLAAAVVWLTLVHQIEANNPPLFSRPSFMGSISDEINMPDINRIRPSINQISNPLESNKGFGSAQPISTPLSQPQQNTTPQGDNIKSPIQDNNQEPTQKNGQPSMQNIRPLQEPNNGQSKIQSMRLPQMLDNNSQFIKNTDSPFVQNTDSPFVKNNDSPFFKNNGFPPREDNFIPPLKMNQPKEQDFGMTDQTQGSSGLQQGSNLPSNSNRPQEVNFNNQQSRPPQEDSFTDNAYLTNTPQEQVQQQYQKKYPQQNQQYPPSFPQKLPNQMSAQPIVSYPQRQPTVVAVPQQRPMESVPPQQQIVSVPQQSQFSSNYPDNQMYQPMDQQNFRGPQQPYYQMPYQTQMSMNYPDTENDRTQTYINSYQIQPSNVPSRTGTINHLNQ
uniref:Uncharacterized protein n=1 Tax=Sipha flava TaxID=143950 RepID=A0A2S2PY20_9HEMI